PTLNAFIQKRWEIAFLQFDANDLIKMLETGIHSILADHSNFGGNLERALASINAKVLLMPCSSDLLFPGEDSVEVARYISNDKVMSVPSILEHAFGHRENKTDNQFNDHQKTGFLATE